MRARMSSRPQIVVWAVTAVLVGGCADDSRRPGAAGALCDEAAP